MWAARTTTVFAEAGLAANTSPIAIIQRALRIHQLPNFVRSLLARASAAGKQQQTGFRPQTREGCVRRHVIEKQALRPR